MKEILPIILLLLVLIVVFVKNTRNYGNDVFKDIPKQYNLFHEQEGVTIYSSWIINQGSASALVFKLINKNKYPVVVNWMGPKWYTKGKDDSNTLNEIVSGEAAYANLLVSCQIKEPTRIDYSTEVLQDEPNYLYYRAPEGEWQPGELTVKFDKFLVSPQIG
jgi:hypothetical protein